MARYNDSGNESFLLSDDGERSSTSSSSWKT